MAKQERNEKKKTNKKELKIVNKESFCATIALFSVLLFLILCTRTLVFGEYGFTIHAFLLGTFGYFAYPLILGLFYVSALGLFGKRMVKNRKLFFCCTMLVLSTGLVLHAALTFSWFDKAQYLTACFNAGESFPRATVCGWVGALLLYGVETLTTKVGVLIVYGIITAFLMYVCITVAGKQPKEKPQPLQKEKDSTQNVEIPLYQQPVQPIQTQNERDQLRAEVEKLKDTIKR